MDQARREGSVEELDHVDEDIDKKLDHSVVETAIDAATKGSWGARASVSGEDRTSQEIGNELGSNKELLQGPQKVAGHGTSDKQEIIETLHGVEQGTSYNSRNMVNERELEAVVVIDPSETVCVNQDNRKLEVKVNDSGLSKVSMKAPKGMSKTDNNSCVIDVKCGSCQGFSENLEGERVCRICHLTSGRPSDATATGSPNNATSTDLIQLGCACKDELGIAHIHCAEAWFKLKGNRLCEICGETAKNVTGVADSGFMEEWNEMRFIDNSNASSGFCRCWRGQPFCNFLMACLVIAFVLPWFFRVNMF